MKQLSILQHPDFGSIRSSLVKGEPWFIAKDICDVLGLTNSRKTLTALDDDEKGVTISDTLGGKQEMAIINESGLYHLIILSRKPEAKVFRKWITSEVLPSIRKNGFYVHPSMKLSIAQQRKLDRVMRDLVRVYITDQDISRCAKRCSRTPAYIRDVLRGAITNNGVMGELQCQAIANKEQLDNPYSNERLQEVINQLSK